MRRSLLTAETPGRHRAGRGGFRSDPLGAELPACRHIFWPAKLEVGSNRQKTAETLDSDPSGLPFLVIFGIIFDGLRDRVF